MRSVYCLLLSVFFSATASAQKVHFIYFETERNVPFYIKMDDQVFSAAAGYLVLSNLADSTYNLSIGYPSQKQESKFSITVSGKDRGFLVKHFDFGQGLYDLQNQSVIKSPVDDFQKNITYRTRTDDFTALLAKASNDSSLLFVPVVMKEDVTVKKQEPKNEVKLPDQTAVKIDTVVIAPPQQDVVKEEVKQGAEADKQEKKLLVDTSVTEEKKLPVTQDVVRQNDKTNAIDSVATPVVEYKRSVIRKHSESSTSEGFGLIFYDKTENGIDTIRLLIPNPKIMISQNETSDTVVDDVKPISKDSTEQKVVVAPVKNSGIIVNSNCKAVASDNDFFKLRKNMASRTSDDSMVDEAKKIFRNKCFTTEQVRNLGSLFLTSAGKYQFFDAAYLHVTDRDQFASLQSDIRDDYYLKRFKALVGE